MGLGRNALEIEHHLVAPDEGPEDTSLSVSAALVQDVESQPGLVELKSAVQIVNDKERSNTVQHANSAPRANYISPAGTLVQVERLKPWNDSSVLCLCG